MKNLIKNNFIIRKITVYKLEMHRLRQFAGHSHRHAPEIRNKISLTQISSGDRRTRGKRERYR